MGRRSERLSGARQCDADRGGRDVIQVVSRAFDILRCFEGHEVRLGNFDIASRCSLPRSTFSRLTHTLTRMGQLVYLPQDQKYRLGPGALAMSTSMARGVQFRGLIRRRLQEVAERLPGTIGFVVPDRFHMVYLEYARTCSAAGLNSSTGSRISIARTAAGHAYVAALDVPAAEALVADMARELREEADKLRSRMAQDRQSLRENGYVVSCKLWHPHIHGIATPLWSAKYRTFLVITIGLVATMYDEARLHKDVAPELLALREDVALVLERSDGALLMTGAAGAVPPRDQPRHAPLAAG
ncbi:MAG: transcriptional regulator [Proteobacteria bacterium]|nr:MAG: transcriptional regulator [Pseudomonadota bacterium]